MEKAKRNNVVQGVLEDAVNHGVNMIKYAYDIIFLFRDDVRSAKNLKFFLCAFEHMSGLTINFHKSELCLFGDVVSKTDVHQEILTCKLGEISLKYLGMPVSNITVRNNLLDVGKKTKLKKDMVVGKDKCLILLVGLLWCNLAWLIFLSK